MIHLKVDKNRHLREYQNKPFLRLLRRSTGLRTVCAMTESSVKTLNVRNAMYTIHRHTLMVYGGNERWINDIKMKIAGN